MTCSISYFSVPGNFIFWRLIVRGLLILLLVALLFPAQPSFAEGSLAQTPAAKTGPLGFGAAEFTTDLESDRPDFTEGTQAIDPGHLQLEAGYTYVRDQNDGETRESHTMPEALLRIGLVKHFELRLTWEGYVEESIENDPNDDSGVTDMGIGYKQELLDQRKHNPSLAYLFELGIPVGSDNQTADGVEPTFKLLGAYDLNDRYSVASNLNLSSLEGEDSNYLEYSASGTVGVGLTEELGTYVEYFGLYPENESGEVDTHYLNGGFTFKACENLQFDVRAGFGLNSAADDLFTGVGVVWRV